MFTQLVKGLLRTAMLLATTATAMGCGGEGVHCCALRTMSDACQWHVEHEVIDRSRWQDLDDVARSGDEERCKMEWDNYYLSSHDSSCGRYDLYPYEAMASCQ